MQDPDTPLAVMLAARHLLDRNDITGKTAVEVTVKPWEAIIDGILVDTPDAARVAAKLMLVPGVASERGHLAVTWVTVSMGPRRDTGRTTCSAPRVALVRSDPVEMAGRQLGILQGSGGAAETRVGQSRSPARPRTCG
jgi:hypothetical protein